MTNEPRNRQEYLTSTDVTYDELKVIEEEREWNRRDIDRMAWASRLAYTAGLGAPAILSLITGQPELAGKLAASALTINAGMRVIKYGIDRVHQWHEWKNES